MFHCLWLLCSIPRDFQRPRQRTDSLGKAVKVNSLLYVLNIFELFQSSESFLSSVIGLIGRKPIADLPPQGLSPLSQVGFSFEKVREQRTGMLPLRRLQTPAARYLRRKNLVQGGSLLGRDLLLALERNFGGLRQEDE